MRTIRQQDAGKAGVRRGVDAPRRRYLQIYLDIRQAIADRRLRPGDRLASARAFAFEHGVARGTVDAAYAMLAGDGLIEVIPRVGAVVARSVASSLEQTDGATVPGRQINPLAPGLPALDLFPRKLWSNMAARAARSLSLVEVVSSDSGGDLKLRDAIANHLSVSRGIRCRSNEIVVTGGFQSGLGNVAELLCRPGQQVLLEDPGYPDARRVLSHFGLSEVLVGVDWEGIIVPEGIAAAPNAKLCVVTPAHQFPLGMRLSDRRRDELLQWAHEKNSWIVEDDFDGEFRHYDRNSSTLKESDPFGRVIYAGTFSKSLFPGVRLGYLVASPDIASRLRQAIRVKGDGRSVIDQATVGEMLRSGHFARHVARMRLSYASRRQALGKALTRSFAGIASVDQLEGGVHLLMNIPGQASRIAEFRPKNPDGLGTFSFSYLTNRPEWSDSLLVGFANVPESKASILSEDLAHAVLGKSRAGRWRGPGNNVK